MKCPLKQLLLIAACLPFLAADTPSPWPQAAVAWHESFDEARTVDDADLFALAGAEGLDITSRQTSGKWLEVTGGAAFGIPVLDAARFRVGFDLTRGAGDGTLSIGDDRDPHHGFASILSVDADGALHTAGTPTGHRLEPGLCYRVELAVRWTSATTFVVDTVTVRGHGLDVVCLGGRPRTGVRGMPLPFVHGGAGAHWIDDLLVKLYAE